MTDEQFEAMCALMMCSDPWPVQSKSLFGDPLVDMKNKMLVEDFMNREAVKHGHENWIDAYLQPKTHKEQPVSAYGFCPICGADGAMRERRPNGNDRCSAGHTYPSKDAK